MPGNTEVFEQHISGEDISSCQILDRIAAIEDGRQDGTFAASMWPPQIAGTIEFYGMHRADLLDMFVSRLPAERIHTGHRCVGFEQAADEATVIFANGARVSADAVIGADGIHSVLQQYVVEPSRPLFSGSVAHRGLITAASVGWPAGQMRNWLGAGKHFLVFPVRANELVNYVGFVTTQEQTRESWSAPGDPEDLKRAFAGWDPMVEAILAQATHTFRWGLYDREPLATWTNGRLTLLGDIPYHYLPVTRATKTAQEAQIKQIVTETGAELVVLARYMQILSDDLASFLSGRCINIHHSFLPGFKGAKPYHQAHQRGVKMIGATAHYVTADLDEGPIIHQDVEPISHADTPDDLVRKGRDIERRVLAAAVQYHLEDRVFQNGSKTVVFQN